MRGAGTGVGVQPRAHRGAEPRGPRDGQGKGHVEGVVRGQEPDGALHQRAPGQGSGASLSRASTDCQLRGSVPAHACVRTPRGCVCV